MCASACWTRPTVSVHHLRAHKIRTTKSARVWIKFFLNACCSISTSCRCKLEIRAVPWRLGVESVFTRRPSLIVDSGQPQKITPQIKSVIHVVHVCIVPTNITELHFISTARPMKYSMVWLPRYDLSRFLAFFKGTYDAAWQKLKWDRTEDRNRNSLARSGRKPGGTWLRTPTDWAQARKSARLPDHWQVSNAEPGLRNAVESRKNKQDSVSARLQK
jgi:hypothetical protein